METESTDKLTPYKTDLEYLDDHFQVGEGRRERECGKQVKLTNRCSKRLQAVGYYKGKEKFIYLFILITCTPSCYTAHCTED